MYSHNGHHKFQKKSNNYLEFFFKNIKCHKENHCYKDNRRVLILSGPRFAPKFGPVYTAAGFLKEYQDFFVILQISIIKIIIIIIIRIPMLINRYI